MAISSRQRLRHHHGIEWADVVGDKHGRPGEPAKQLTLAHTELTESREGREQEAGLQSGAHPPHAARSRPESGVHVLWFDGRMSLCGDHSRRLDPFARAAVPAVTAV